MKRKIIIVVGGIITAVLLLSAWGFVSQRLFPERDFDRQTRMQMAFLAAAANEARLVHGDWPASIQELASHPNDNMKCFLNFGTNDSWGHPVIFEPFSSSRGYGRITSHGDMSTKHDIILHYGHGADYGISFLSGE